jgi:hypothetical protein
MPNAADHTSDRTTGAGRDDLTGTALLVEQDFRRLVDTLKWMVKTAEQSDKELVDRLVCTKVVAERGLRLSKLLSSVTRKPRN